MGAFGQLYLSDGRLWWSNKTFNTPPFASPAEILGPRSIFFQNDFGPIIPSTENPPIAETSPVAGISSMTGIYLGFLSRQKI